MEQQASSSARGKGDVRVEISDGGIRGPQAGECAMFGKHSWRVRPMQLGDQITDRAPQAAESRHDRDLTSLNIHFQYIQALDIVIQHERAYIDAFRCGVVRFVNTSRCRVARDFDGRVGRLRAQRT